MKRYFVSTLCAVLAVFLCGCTLQPPQKTTVTSSVGVYTVPELSSPLEIERTEQVGDKTIVIHAAVVTVEKENLFTVELTPDIGAWAAFGEKLLTDYAQEIDSAVQSGSMDIAVKEGNQLWKRFSLGRYSAGDVVFWDGEKDLNGSDLDSSWSHSIPHYRTQLVPSATEITADEAAEKVCELLDSHSCLRFTPWNITAGYDSQNMKGYYHIMLQPQMDDVPIYPDLISAFYSDEGLFSCRGTVFLQERERIPVESVFPLERAVEQFIANCPAYAYTEKIVCQQICLGYILTSEEDVVTLSPAWIFECQEDMYSEDGLQIVNTRYYNCGFLLKSGEFWLD